MKEFISSPSIDKDRVFTREDLIAEMEREEKKVYYLGSGSKNVDTILAHGFRSKSMYLIFGANKTGKTQLCHQLCIQAYKSSLNVIYFDTENTFRPERIKQLSQKDGLNFKEILKAILVSKIMSNNAFLLKLGDIEQTIKHSQVKVILIDSINNYYRLEQGDDDTTYEKAKANFLKILEKLYGVTKSLNLITIATAQVSANFSKSASKREKPVGNQFLNQFFSEYLYLNYNMNDFGYLHLLHSSRLPEKKLLYRLTDKGIEDYKL